MDYRETARKLRAKAEDKATPESERAVLLAKAEELEDKYGKEPVGAFALRVPPYVHGANDKDRAYNGPYHTAPGPFKSPFMNAMFEDLVEDIYRTDDGPHDHGEW